MKLKLPNTPCCKYVKAFFRWLWNFLFRGKRLFLNFILLPSLTAYFIFLLWGYYIAGILEFNPIYYPYLPEKDKLILLCVGIFLVFVVIYALVMQHARSERLDCSIRNTHIARLAKLWLDEEEIKSQMLEANKEWRNKQMEQIEAEAANRMLIVSTEIVGRFISERLAAYLKRFSNDEIDILRFLFNLLEKQRNVPSVAFKYKNDYDVKQFRNGNGSKPIPITSDGKTSYEILSTYSLLNHSIRVASFIIDEIKNRTNTYSILMPKAIIVALAHDIGKIEKSGSSLVNEEVASVTDHPYLSAMIIKERFPSYRDIDEIASIVQEHHLPIDKSGTICAVALKAADQRARREEIKRWFIKTYGSEAKSPDPYMIYGADSLASQENERGDGNRDNKRGDRDGDSNQDSNRNNSGSNQNNKRGDSDNQEIKRNYSDSHQVFGERIESEAIVNQRDDRGKLTENDNTAAADREREATKRTIIEIPPIFAVEYNDDTIATQNDKSDENDKEAVKEEWDLEPYIASYNENDRNYETAENELESPLKPFNDNSKKSKASVKTKSKSKFGETKTPKTQTDEYRTLEFDLPSCEAAILDQLKSELIVIERSGANMFVPSLNILSVPYDDYLLVSFARITGLIGGLFDNAQEGDLDYGAMTRYAVNEWRKKKTILLVGEGYATRKYEYLYDGEQRKVINMIPFSIDALELNADDLQERAKQHPLFLLIGELKMGKG